MLVITYNNSSEDVNSEDEFDKIEILSSNIETADEFFLAPISSFSKKELIALDIRERQRKRIARIVALVSGILLLVSVALVTFSLYMAKDIDELGTLQFIIKTSKTWTWRKSAQPSPPHTGKTINREKAISKQFYTLQ